MTLEPFNDPLKLDIDRAIESWLAATRVDATPDIAAIAARATQARQEPALLRARPAIWIPTWAAAACACLLLGYVAGAGFERQDEPRAVSFDLMFGPGDGLGR